MNKKSVINKNRKRHTRSKSIKADIKKNTRAMRKAVEKKDAPLANEKLGDVLPKLDRAARKGIISKNAAARSKSKITKRVNSLAAK